METVKISKKQIYDLAPKMDAVKFDAFCEEHKIDNTWLDVTITNYNEGYYNVDLPKFGLNVIYYDGVFEEISEL